MICLDFRTVSKFAPSVLDANSEIFPATAEDAALSGSHNCWINSMKRQAGKRERQSLIMSKKLFANYSFVCYLWSLDERSHELAASFKRLLTEP